MSSSSSSAKRTKPFPWIGFPLGRHLENYSQIADKLDDATAHCLIVGQSFRKLQWKGVKRKWNEI